MATRRVASVMLGVALASACCSRIDRKSDAIPVVQVEDGSASALPAAASAWAGPGLPPFDAPTVARVRAIRARGLAMGNSSSVFAKVGDSITASPSFMREIGLGNSVYGSYGALATTVSHFAGTLSDGANAFTHASAAARNGWGAQDPLGPPDALAQEVATVRPAYAIVMLGTNDFGMSAALFRGNLEQVLDRLEELGTVAIVSTIPDRRDHAQAQSRVLLLNREVRAAASARHTPLVDLYEALAPVAQAGLSADAVHPSSAPGNAADFTPSGLAYGYNIRNLLALQVLDRVRRL